MTGAAKLLGVSGMIAGYEVVTLGDRLAVYRDEVCVGDEVVRGLAKFVARAGACIRLGFARTADFEIVYLYDKADENFGYALNLTAPDLSEWGYAPFRREDPREDRCREEGKQRSRSTRREVRA